MAEIPMTGQGVQPAEPRSIGPLVNMIGAVASLALVAGTGVWGYKLLMRDVSGVPVVRAVEGPMRIQPEDPGGRQADHQGLAVNRVAAAGSAAAPADRLTLAPAPINLSDEDGTATGSALIRLQQASAPQGEALRPSTSRNTAAPLTRSQIQPRSQMQAALSGQAQAGSDDIIAPPRLSTDGSAVPAAQTQGAGKAATGPGPVVAGADDDTRPTRPVFTNGVAQSLRPVLRPDDLGDPVKLAALGAQAAAPATTAPAVIDAAEIPAGTHLVQLGAFASPEIAANEWDRLSTRFRDYLGSKTRIIQQATSGGREFYRLRAMGFADLSDARRMCSALKAERADCIPVTIR